jgi:hypothetical protein
MTFKINASGLVKLFLDKYQIWCDQQDFYKDSHPVQIVNDPLGIPCFHHTDIKNINLCTNKLIIIDCLTEGIHVKNNFNRYNADKHYIIFSNGWWDQNIFQLKINYTLIHVLYFLFDMTDTYLSPNKFSFYLDKDYQFDYPKQNNFMSTIGNVRPERTYFVDQMIKKCTYKNFILRYSGEDFGLPSNCFDHITFSKGKFDPYTSILEKYYHNVSQSVPIKMYNTAYFNVIVETIIDSDNLFFLTEKTIKSLITGMPFIVISTPNFLKHLCKLGFHTYNSLWDESYDTETDYKTRIDKVIELCNNLENFDWHKHRLELEMIKLKNRNNFLILNNIASKEFTNFEKKLKNIVQ